MNDNGKLHLLNRIPNLLAPVGRTPLRSHSTSFRSGHITRKIGKLGSRPIFYRNVWYNIFMPRQARMQTADTVFHVINRSNGRVSIFNTDEEYQHFEELLKEGVEDIGMRILSYCIMPNHWHLVLHPRTETDMGEFMRWITTTHVRQRRVNTESVGHGHLYQGAYKSFPVETDVYLATLIRYVEQNPLRAKLVKQAQDWKWSSLWKREYGSKEQQKLLSDLPIDLPDNYLEIVNTLPDTEKIEKIRRSVNKGAPLGSDEWVVDTVKKYGLESTLRGPGRPRQK